eukprot:gene3565-biopygen12105
MHAQRAWKSERGAPSRAHGYRQVPERGKNIWPIWYGLRSGRHESPALILLHPFALWAIPWPKTQVQTLEQTLERNQERNQSRCGPTQRQKKRPNQNSWYSSQLHERELETWGGV